MIDEPLKRLTRAECDGIFDHFDAKFDFRPNIYDYPGITEPSPSVTWSLDALKDDPWERKLSRLVDVVQDGLAGCCKPGESLWVLNWNHTCYQLRPDLPATDMFLPRGRKGCSREGWPISPYPAGDYFIFLAEDLRFGTFGHPWEHSLCLFGAELLDVVQDDVQQVLQRVLRRDGGVAD